MTAKSEVRRSATVPWLWIAICAIAVLMYQARANAASRELLGWFFDQAELQAGDCDQGYPCHNYHGAPTQISANFMAMEMETRMTEQDGSLIDAHTSSSSEATNNTTPALPETKSSWRGALEAMAWGGAGQLAQEGVEWLAGKVAQMGMEALSNANMLLPSSGPCQRF